MSREQNALAAVLALHWEWRIYDDCGHDHQDCGHDYQEGDPGTVAIDDLGIVCQDGYVCSICAECCAGRGHGQTEECASDHTDPCWPCPTVQAIRDAMGVPG